jgi:hypothetical protein
MVATHDLLESTIISEFENTIPPIANKSIADFVFNGIPYDLKNTNFPQNWDKRNTKLELINNLFYGADEGRIRKQAESSFNGWGLNRLYVIVENQDRWMEEPNQILLDLKAALQNLEDPIILNVHGKQIYTQLIIL